MKLGHGCEIRKSKTPKNRVTPYSEQARLLAEGCALHKEHGHSKHGWLLSNALLQDSDEISCHASRGQWRGNDGLALPTVAGSGWRWGHEAYYKPE